MRRIRELREQKRLALSKEISVFSEFYVGPAILEGIILLSYVLICAALFKRRYSRLATIAAFGAAGIAITAAQSAIVSSGGETLMFTLLPLTAYLPFSVLLFFLSENGVFGTAAVCSIGTLDVLILKSLRKILEGFHMTETPEYVLSILFTAIIAIAAAGLVFVTFRFIREPFRVYVLENKQRRTAYLLALPIILIFLLMFYFLNSTTTEVTLLITMLTVLSVFYIIARLLSTETKLTRSKRSEIELTEYIEAQRRGYDSVVRKMEAAREYRHDMRHHLAVIEGLAKQGECDKIAEYTSKLNGLVGAGGGEPENIGICKDPELNAVLSEYVSRAERAGCKVTHSLALPEALPFERNDICLVLANTIENAINACLELPEDARRINVSAEYKDGRRLMISVENPCSREVRFGEDGLPVTDKRSDEHGIGLRSVKRIVEKYNGFLWCMLENGNFVFQAALFYDNSPSGHRTKGARIVKRLASSTLGMILGGIFVLNVMPSVADAASELTSINILTIRSFNFGWGSSSIKIDAPEFGGDGADELNSAVKNYTDEAKEKFLWYFSRKYNGYVGEDMQYTVIRDDEKYFIARFNVTVNAGGSLDYSRWIVYGKEAGKVLELSDLFKEGSDYVGIISAEILEQMKFRNEHEDGTFFTDGSDAFTAISEDANFYIDSFDRLVIVFDEYEVAPGAMGSPEFFITKKIMREIARWSD